MTKTESVMNEPTPIPNILAGSVWEPLNKLQAKKTFFR